MDNKVFHILKDGFILLVISISSYLVYFIVNNPFSFSLLTLSAFLTIVIIALTIANVCITYFQYTMANTPLIDGDMVKDPTNTWLDLKISNKGSGLAIGIKWVLKVETLTARAYINQIGYFFNPKIFL